jgi:hypothetical protein
VISERMRCGLYSPECVEEEYANFAFWGFSEVPPEPDPMLQGFLCRVSEVRSLMYIRNTMPPGGPARPEWGYADFHILCSRAHTFPSQTNMVQPLAN